MKFMAFAAVAAALLPTPLLAQADTPSRDTPTAVQPSPLRLKATSSAPVPGLTVADVEALNAVFAAGNQQGLVQCGLSPVSTAALSSRSASERLRRFGHGDLNARLCALAALELLRTPIEPSALGSSEQNAGAVLNRFAVEATRDLEYFYQRRAERQQTFIDWSSGVTVVGVAGAAGSGRVGAATQRAWGYAALLPVVLGQLNAHEPTRNLYSAGALGLTLIQARYAVLAESEREIDITRITLDRNCAPAGTYAVAGSAPATQAATHALLAAERNRLVGLCLELGDRVDRLGRFDASLRAASLRHARGLAADAYALDDRLLRQDRDLRFTPLETLRNLATAPFRAVDSLISGQDVDGAVSGFQSALALDRVSLTLSEVHLRPGPAALDEPIRVNVDTFARASAEGGAAATAAQGLATFARSLEATREEYAAQRAAAERARAAAAARHLNVRYDASAGVPVVTLAGEAAEVVAPTQSASTP